MNTIIPHAEPGPTLDEAIDKIADNVKQELKRRANELYGKLGDDEKKRFAKGGRTNYAVARILISAVLHHMDNEVLAESLLIDAKLAKRIEKNRQ